LGNCEKDDNINGLHSIARITLVNMIAHEQYDVGFPERFSLLICGPSFSGKSVLLNRLIKSGMLHPRTKKIVYFCNSKYKDLPSGTIRVNSFEELEKYLKPNNLIILDDLGHEACSSSLVCDFFTKRVHHDGFSCVLMLQNLYTAGKFSRTITQNCQYLIYFKNPRDQTVVRYLSRQIFPDNPYLVSDAYKHAVRTPHGYIFLNLTQNCPDYLRVRTNILDPVTTVYMAD